MSPQSDEKPPAKGKADEIEPPEKERLRLIEECANNLRKLLESYVSACTDRDRGLNAAC